MLDNNIEENHKKMPVFKGRKVTQFHIGFVSKYLDKILTGEINISEMLKMLKQECLDKNETIIKDHGTIQRIVFTLLKDKPEELEEYKKTIRNNTGKRTLGAKRFENVELGQYKLEEKKFKQMIIDKYLPKILCGEMTLDMVERESAISHQTINKVVKEYYLYQNDNEGFEKYQEAKRNNIGTSLEKRDNAQKMRREVSDFNVVTNAEFLLLSPKEQEEQVMMKIRKCRLKEERQSPRKTVVTTEKTTKIGIQRIMKYFQGKNYDNKIWFSDEDIRYMIFRYPTLVNRSEENLEEKIKVLESYEDISEEIAYGMIKVFPAIMGYDAKRTKGQLDLLESEKLMDYIIYNPAGLMRSESLMYALIQYAKERHNTSDLTNVNRSNIFMGNNTMKRFYKTSYDEIKQKFPHNARDEKDSEYTIYGEDLGKATYRARGKSNEASKVLSDAIKKQEKGLR